MTPDEYASIASEEICSAMSRALVDINEACDDDECSLTPRQKMLVGTALLRECMALGVDLPRMFENASVLDCWSAPAPLLSVGDEIADYLAQRDRDEQEPQA